VFFKQVASKLIFRKLKCDKGKKYNKSENINSLS